jgi:hypothetical protein
MKEMQAAIDRLDALLTEMVKAQERTLDRMAEYRDALVSLRARVAALESDRVNR